MEKIFINMIIPYIQETLIRVSLKEKEFYYPPNLDTMDNLVEVKLMDMEKLYSLMEMILYVNMKELLEIIVLKDMGLLSEKWKYLLRANKKWENEWKRKIHS